MKALAKAHGVDPTQVYRWRGQYGRKREGESGAALLPVRVSEESVQHGATFGRPAQSSGPPSPEQAISGAMPRDNHLRLDYNERFGPTVRDRSENQPEQPIGRAQFRTRVFAVVNGELLPKCQGLSCQSMA